ncbi:MAG: hypothetical protein ACRENF_08315, partial [Thermodesulfobacteriota bacterium]
SDIFTHWHDEARNHGYTWETIEALRRRPEEKVKREEKRTAQREPKIEESQKGRGEQQEKPRREEPKREAPAPKTGAEAARKGSERVPPRAKIDALTESASVMQKEGLKVVFVTYSRAEAERLQKAGLTAAHVSIYIRENETPKEERERMRTRPERSLIDKLTLKPNPSPNERKIYAEFKYLTGQWSGKTKAKYLGEYHKPTSEFAHQFKYATGQISKKHQDYLNSQLGKKDRELTDKTLLVRMEGEGPAMKNLKFRAESKGAMMIDCGQLIELSNRRKEERQEVNTYGRQQQQSHQ